MVAVRERALIQLGLDPREFQAVLEKSRGQVSQFGKDLDKLKLLRVGQVLIKQDSLRAAKAKAAALDAELKKITARTKTGFDSFVKFGEGAGKALQGAAKLAGGLGIALGASVLAGKKLFGVFKTAAGDQDAIRIFEASGGSVAKLRNQVGGLASDAALVKKANLARVMGITAHQFGEFGKIAQAASITTGQSFEYMFDSIVTGSARGSRLILDNLGIIVSAEKAQENFAQMAGKTVKSLSEAERKTAFIEEVIRKGATLTEGVAATGESQSMVFSQIEASIANISDGIMYRWLPDLKQVASVTKELADLTAAARAEEVADFRALQVEVVQRERKHLAGLSAVARAVEGGGPMSLAARPGMLDGLLFKDAEGGVSRAFQGLKLLREQIKQLTVDLRAAEIQAGLRKPDPVAGTTGTDAEREKMKRERERAAEARAREAEKQRKLEESVWLDKSAMEAEARAKSKAQIDLEFDDAARRANAHFEMVDKRAIDDAREREREITRIKRDAEEDRIRLAEEAKKKREDLEREELAFTQRIFNETTNLMTSTADFAISTALSSIESLAGGEKIAFEKILFEFMKMIGGQIMGIGMRTVAEGIAMSSVPPYTLGIPTIAAGAAITAAGFGIAAGGAAGAGFLSRGGGGGGSGAGPSAPFASGVNRGSARTGGGGGGSGMVTNTFVFNAPVLSEPTGAAREVEALQTQARRDLLLTGRRA